MVPTIDEILKYCHDKLAISCMSSQHSSAMALSHWRTSESTECSWQVATVSDTNLQPPWVCHFELYTMLCQVFNPLKGRDVNWLHLATQVLPTFLISDIRALWCTGLNALGARVPECQKFKMYVRPGWH